MLLRWALFLALSVIFCKATPLHSSSYPLIAPLHVPPVSHNDLFNNTYIVMFKDDVQPLAFELHLQFLSFVNDMHPLRVEGERAGLEHVYDSVVAKGYAGKFSEAAIEMIRRRPEVKYVERDQIMRPDTTRVQTNPTWGLARINHRNRLYRNNMHYVYEGYGGYGVFVYIIDSGVHTSHKEFEGRASWGTTFFPNEGYVDRDGHGTHVAGTIGSKTYGVAKNAMLRAVKVFSPSTPGSTSTVIKGIEWAVKDAARLAQANPDTFRGAVINMSLGGGRSQATDDAANNAVRAGAHVVVSSGNDNKDACNQSPAAAELVITVGASRIDDFRADFSNWGRCVDVHAPGASILSTWIGSDTATNVLDGTSMSAPHVSGLVAYFLSIYPHWTFNPTSLLDVDDAKLYEPRLIGKNEPLPLSPKATGLTPYRLKKALLGMSSRRKLSGLPSGTPNLLIFNNFTHKRIVPEIVPANDSFDQ